MPSKVPIHSRYTGMSFCWTGTNSTSGGPESADAFDLAQPAAIKTAGIKTIVAQISIFLLNAVVTFVSCLVHVEGLTTCWGGLHVDNHGLKVGIASPASRLC